MLNWFKRKNKNRVKNEFAKYGHRCEIPEEKDDVAEYYSPKTCWNNIRKTFFHVRTVSDISKTYARHLRSHGSIMEERKRHLLEYNYIIHPYSYFRVIWEVILCFVLIFHLILEPLKAGFTRIEDGQIENEVFYLLDYVIWLLDIILLGDIGVNMFTGFYSERNKEVVLDNKLIFLHYLKTLLIPDVISSMPLNSDLFKGNNDMMLLVKILSLLKFLRCITFVKYYNRIMNFFRVRHSCSSFLLLFIGLILYWHSIACYLIFANFLDRYAAALTSDGKHKSTSSQGLSRRQVYISFFYKASMIIYSSWYSRDKPKGLAENTAVTVMWFTSKVIQFFLLAKTLQIIKGMNSSHQKYVQMERQLKEYMRDKQLPIYLRARLLTYYEYRFEGNFFRENEILSTISGQLRQEIVMHSCRKLVQHVSFFKNLPMNLLVRIVSCLKDEMYLMNDVIVRANTPGDCMYFIASGTVAVYSTSGKEICHLEDGSHFGEIALVKKSEFRVASAVALEICEVYRFDEKDFVRAIHPYPDLLDSIEKIATDRMEKTMMLDEHNRRQLAVKRKI